MVRGSSSLSPAPYRCFSPMVPPNRREVKTILGPLLLSIPSWTTRIRGTYWGISNNTSSYTCQNGYNQADSATCWQEYGETNPDTFMMEMKNDIATLENSFLFFILYVFPPVCIYVCHVTRCLMRPSRSCGLLEWDLQTVVSSHEDAGS